MKPISHVALRYGAGYVIFTVCRMLQAIMLARMLGPVMLGLWSALTLYRQYGQHSDLGMSKGIGQLVPRYIHSGHRHRADIIVGLGWGVGMIVTGVASAVVFAQAILFRDFQASFFWEGVITLVVLLFIDKHYLCLTSLYQSTERIAESGIWMGILGSLELALCGVLTTLFGLRGLYVSLIASVLIVTWCMHQRGGVQFVFRMNRKLLTELFASSLLLTGFGLLNMAIHNLDRVAITTVCGAGSELSYYHIASIFSMIVSQLPSIIMVALAPRIYRFTQNDVSELRSCAILPTALIASVSAAFVVVLWVGLPLFFECFLPEYVLALPVSRILIVGEFFFASTMAMENVNISLGRARYTLFCRFIFAGISLFVAWWLLSIGAGLVPVAVASCAVHVAGWLLSSLMVTQGLTINFWRYIWLVIAPLGYGSLIVALATVCFPADTPYGMSAALACCVLGVGPLILTTLACAKFHILETGGLPKRTLDWWRAHVVNKSVIDKGLVNVGNE